MSGITRDVFVYSKPKTNVYDFFVKAGLNSNYSKGVFEILIDINYGKKVPSKLNVEVEIASQEGAKFPLNKLYVEELKKKDILANEKSEGHSTKHICCCLDE